MKHEKFHISAIHPIINNPLNIDQILLGTAPAFNRHAPLTEIRNLNGLNQRNYTATTVPEPASL